MDTKTKILDEALQQFNLRGLNRVGVREIARSLKISPGNMSYHFPKKEGLVLALLLVFSADNQRMFVHYHSNAKNLNTFLKLFNGIFHNQYRYRGVLTDLVEVNRLLTSATDYDYSEFQKRRVAEFRKILNGLNDAGELGLDLEQLEQLVAHISLFGRFWIAEAFIDSLETEEDELIDRYLKMFADHLSLYATEKGKRSIQEFSVQTSSDGIPRSMPHT